MAYKKKMVHCGWCKGQHRLGSGAALKCRYKHGDKRVTKSKK